MRISARVLPLLFSGIVCVGTSCLTAAQAPSAEPPKRSSSARLNDSLAVKLMGSWVLEKATTPGKPSGIGTRMKTFSDGRWEIVQRDPKTHEIIFNHGGSYHVEGDILVQKVEFAGPKTKSYIGRVSKFRITVDKDTYTQVALDNQFNEVWKRVDDV
ncbi:MAG TPA: hypothetical protein VGE76_12770 [Opitutaceae bacterium]